MFRQMPLAPRGVLPWQNKKFSESLSLHDCSDLIDEFCLYSKCTEVIGNLKNQDEDGYENVTTKGNSRCLKRYRAYSISFNSSNVGKCFWSWILKDCIKVLEKERKLLSCVPVLDKKSEIRHFHVVVMQRQQNMTVQKGRDALAKLLLC